MGGCTIVYPTHINQHNCILVWMDFELDTGYYQMECASPWLYAGLLRVSEANEITEYFRTIPNVIKNFLWIPFYSDLVPRFDMFWPTYFDPGPRWGFFQFPVPARNLFRDQKLTYWDPYHPLPHLGTFFLILVLAEKLTLTVSNLTCGLKLERILPKFGHLDSGGGAGKHPPHNLPWR